MVWHFGDTPETPCFGAPLLFFAATDCELLTYDRLASCAEIGFGYAKISV
jgi:hypothetical protein